MTRGAPLSIAQLSRQAAEVDAELFSMMPTAPEATLLSAGWSTMKHRPSPYLHHHGISFLAAGMIVTAASFEFASASQ